MGRPDIAVFAIVLGLAACAKASAPEQIADQFAEAYFGRADQEKAKEFTALGATSMLDAEIQEVTALRKDGYGPNEAGSNVTYRRNGEPTKRDQRVRVAYEITVHTSGTDSVRDADVELAEIQGAWKVVRIGLKPR